MMDNHWQRSQGWSVPNPNVYPWLWSWDSCFHALVWDALHDQRAVVELIGVFRAQTISGFIPHINYEANPGAFASFWGIPGASTLTQPPMYGHVLATLAGHGHDVRSLVEPALRGMRRLFAARRTPCGLLRVLHPWESGIDDNPRWSAWQPDPWEPTGWHEVKGRLVEALVVDEGEAVASSAFDVCSASFNALVAWNAIQLAGLTNDDRLLREGRDLAENIDENWVDDLCTWADVMPDGTRGSSIRTLDALLSALVTTRSERAEAALHLTLEPASFGFPFGPAGVHRDEPSYNPTGYGRGSTWPNLTYLLWKAALERGHSDVARRLGRLLVEGAASSGLAEYWDPRNGDGLGAKPQAWSGLAILVPEDVGKTADATRCAD